MLNYTVIINARIQGRQQLNSNWIGIDSDLFNLKVHVNHIQSPYDRSLFVEYTHQLSFGISVKIRKKKKKNS